MVNRLHMLESGHGEAVAGKKRFFAKPILGRVQYFAPRVDRDEFLRRLDRRRRHILKLEGHHVDGAGKLPNRVEIFVSGGRLDVRHMSGRRVRIR